MKTQDELKIGCYINARQAFGKSVLKGILDWKKERIHCRVMNYAQMEGLDLFQPHGIIAQLGDERSHPFAKAQTIPLVNVSSALPHIPFPTVTADNEAVGAAGAAHLMNNGVKRLAFARYPWTHYSELRERGFTTEVARRGGELCPGLLMPREKEPQNPKGHPFTDSQMVWVQSLPAKCGVMTDCEGLGSALIACAVELGRHVPDDIAVIAADHEYWLSELSDPPLSCVPLPGRVVGWRAAELLASILEGAAPPTEPILIPPGKLMVRQSSEVLQVPDEHVREAMRFIRAHPGQNLGVPEVVRVSGVSRRSLEMKFRVHLNRTIREVIEGAHLKEALRLLEETTLPMEEVSDAAGFANVQRMAQLVKATSGLTPLSYRKQRRDG
ncbi:MAG: substrate-binding domain-containing protein [Verrucomicrobia bacterium]|nr:substrate-binding domain-containing protein [Verrucomicrobiota bacterium]MCH8511814.1 substrate-binding domain-containing protein [Kiritimatiellia bacterium]